MATRRCRRLWRQRPGQVRSGRCRRAHRAHARACALHARPQVARSHAGGKSPPSLRTASRSWSKNLKNKLKERRCWRVRRWSRRPPNRHTIHPSPPHERALPPRPSPTVAQAQGVCAVDAADAAAGDALAAGAHREVLPLHKHPQCPPRAPRPATPRARPSLPRARPLAPWAVVRRAEHPPPTPTRTHPPYAVALTP